MHDIEQIKVDMVEYLKKLEGSKLNICYDIYQKFLKGRDNLGELLRCYYEQIEKLDSNQEIEVSEIYSKEMEDEYIKKYSKLVDGILEKTLKQKLSKQKFYEEISKLVSMDALFEDELAKAFAIYCIGLDARVPYFEISDPIVMAQDEYTKITNNIFPLIQKARFIMTSDYDQWSEVGDLLTKVLNEAEGPREKAVLMSHILKICEKMFGSKQLMQQISAMKEELEDAEGEG